MPDEAGFVVEGSGLERRRRNTGDVAGEGEDIGSDVAELGEVEKQSSRRRRRRRRRGAEFGIEVGEVDIGIVTKLKKMVFSFFPQIFLIFF